jgi:branched-chain amino acid transport system permease protein
LVTLQKVRVAPSASFSITDWTIFILFVVVIGGIGSLEGPIIGTALFLLLREYLADFGAWYLILLGAVSIAIILIEPRGLWGVWRRFFPIDVIPVSHKSPEDMKRADLARTSPLEHSHFHRAKTEEKA